MHLLTYCVGLLSISSLCSSAAVLLEHNGLQKRDVASEALAVVSALYGSILEVDSRINATRAGLNADSTIIENATALATFQADIVELTSLVTQATGQVTAIGIPVDKRAAFDLFARQDPPSTTVIDLSNLLVTLLLEVENTINPLLDNLGLGPLLDAVLIPLEQAVNALVGALGELVDGLIAVLVPILDALTKAIGAIIGPILGALLGFLGIGTPA